MVIKDIDILKRLTSNLDLYDLNKLTFRFTFEGLSFGEYKVKKGEEMRIDLVCNSIYGNIDNVDILLNINNISNPLNIKEGSILRYPSVDSISILRVKESRNNSVQASLSSSNKASIQDSARQQYVEQNYSLPPNVMERPTEQTQILGNTIKIGTGLFNK